MDRQHKAKITSEKKKKLRTQKFIEDKIDEFNEDTFPASDPPAWSSLRRMANKLPEK